MSPRISLDIRPEVQRLLGKLRARIRRYVFLEGTALVLVLLGALFWFSFLLDVVYFWISRLELPRWFRMGFVVLAVSGAAAALAAWVLLRTFRSLRARALALVLERRFPELDDRLITAVEADDSAGVTQTELTRAMLLRTIEDVSRACESLSIGEVFNKAPIRRAIVGAVVLAASIGGFWATNASAMERWANAFLFAADEYWDRDTNMLVRVVTQPGDVIRNFKDASGRSTEGRPGVYLHPRGGDLTLHIDVPRRAVVLDQLLQQQAEIRQRAESLAPAKDAPDQAVRELAELQKALNEKLVRLPEHFRLPLPEQPVFPQALAALESGDLKRAAEPLSQAETRLGNHLADKEWKVPDQAQIRYRLYDDEGRTRARNKTYLTRLGDRRFKFAMGSLQDNLEFYVQGGDFTNRRPFQVLVVDPPRIDQIQLECDYPDYTGLDEIGPRSPVVKGTQISLPAETAFTLHAKANKPLVGVRIQTDGFEVTLGNGSSELTVFSQEQGTAQRVIALPDDLATPLTPDGSNEFRVRFVLPTEAAKQLADMNSPGPIPLPSDSLLRIYLEDVDEITSSDPARLTINGRVDDPPLVETRLTGIGSSITRQATIPVGGLIKDDYGVVKARFEFRVDDQEYWRARAFRNPPERLPDRDDPEVLSTLYPKEFRIRTAKPDAELTGSESPDELFYGYEQFRVLPLDLQIGQKLLLTVYAEDGDNLNGPHNSRSEQYTFKIVSAEELLSILYNREISLRQRFEQIIREVKETRERLQHSQERIEEARALRADDPETHADELKQIDNQLGASAARSGHQINKNHSETLALAENFEDILDELVNNAIHTGQQVDRIRALIVRPLHEINEIDYPQVDRAIGAFKVAHEQGEDPSTKLAVCVDEISQMLARMETVLKEMQDLAEFHEAIADLKEIIEDAEDLKDAIRKKQKQDALNRLKDFGLD